MDTADVPRTVRSLTLLLINENKFCQYTEKKKTVMDVWKFRNLG